MIDDDLTWGTMDAATIPFDICPLTPDLGAEIHGIDLSGPLPPDFFSSIKRALAKHQVLLIRGQDLDRDQLIRIGEGFGEILPGMRKSRNEIEDLKARVEGNVDGNGHPKGRLYDSWGLFWHADASWAERTATATLLYSVQIPERDGDTEFADMYSAYDALSPEERDRLSDLDGTHDVWRGRAFRHGLIWPWARHPFADIHLQSWRERLYHWLRMVVKIVRETPPTHPLITTHPDTGRKCLYVGDHVWRATAMPRRMGVRLIDDLNRHAIEAANIYRHNWKAGDLVIWDNRSLLHRLLPFDTRDGRQMRRVVVIGDPPAR